MLNLCCDFKFKFHSTDKGAIRAEIRPMVRRSRPHGLGHPRSPAVPEAAAGDPVQDGTVPIPCRHDARTNDAATLRPVGES